MTMTRCTASGRPSTALESVLLTTQERESLDFLKRNPTTSVVAVEDGKIVGAILCGHDGRRGCLYHVCVDEHYRKCGIGKSMVVACMRALQAEHINKVSIIAFKVNEAGKPLLEGRGMDIQRRLKLL